MANTNLTNSIITTEALAVLTNELNFTSQVNREYDDQFAKSGGKIGNTLNIRKPPRYVGTTGPLLNVENSVDTSVPLVLTTQAHVDISFSTAEMALDIDDFSNRYVLPAMTVLANRVDADGMLQYQNVYNAVGVAGTTPTSFSTYIDAGVKLDNESAPRSEKLRSVVVNPQAQGSIVNNNTALFNAAPEVSDQYRSAQMRKYVMGWNWGMDQNVVNHVVGPQGGTPAVNAAGQTGATLVTNGWTAAAALRLRKGDVFTIAGVFGVNGVSRQATNQLRQFVVTADTSSDGSGNASIPISPAIVISGAFQTVSAAPGAGALITVAGAANTVTPQNLAFHRDAFTLGMADLADVSGMGAECVIKRDKQLGISIRMVRQYSISNDQAPTRFDILYGWATLRPEWAARIYG